MIFRLKLGYFGAEENVCHLETNIQILSLTDLLIPADGQIKVDIFRHKHFSIWSMETKVTPVLVKNCTKILFFGVLSSNMTKSLIFFTKTGTTLVLMDQIAKFLCLNKSTFICPSAGINKSVQNKI